MVSLNQLKKDYNNSLGEIPEERLKEIFHQLYYQAYHAIFIERDPKAEEKALKIILDIQKNNNDWKVFRASSDAIIKVPLQILMELHNQKNAEIKDLASLFRSYLYISSISVIELNNMLINKIDNCKPGEEKECLNWIKTQLKHVCDEEKSRIEEDYDSGNIQKVIDYLESKPEILGDEKVTLKLLKAGSVL